MLNIIKSATLFSLLALLVLLFSCVNLKEDIIELSQFEKFKLKHPEFSHVSIDNAVYIPTSKNSSDFIIELTKTQYYSEQDNLGSLINIDRISHDFSAKPIGGATIGFVLNEKNQLEVVMSSFKCDKKIMGACVTGTAVASIAIAAADAPLPIADVFAFATFAIEVYSCGIMSECLPRL